MQAAHALTSPNAYLGTTPKPGASLSRQLSSPEAFDPAGSNTNSTNSTNDGCSGFLNEINMDEFFEAWGSSASEFDIDNSGVVDGSDLAIFIGMGAASGNTPVDDVEENWGSSGDNSGDLNGDQVVDGADLAIALAGGAVADDSSDDTGDANSTPDEGNSGSTALEDLLADWGSDSEDSDLNGDGIVDGQDISLLLGGGNLEGQFAVQGIPIPQYADRMVGLMSQMGFDKAPPSNLGQIIEGFNFRPIDAKSLAINVLDLYGKA